MNHQYTGKAFALGEIEFKRLKLMDQRPRSRINSAAGSASNLKTLLKNYFNHKVAPRPP
jgi:hypothetical protein